LGNKEGGSFTWDFEGKVNYFGMCRRKLWRQVYLSTGEPEWSPFTGNFKR
jgi:hypothetical protein